MITGIRCYLPPGTLGNFQLFTRAVGDQYVAGVASSTSSGEPSLLDDWLAVNTGTLDSDCNLPPITPVNPGQTASQQRTYWETVWNNYNNQYEQLQIANLSGNTYTQDIQYGNFYTADQIIRLMSIEGLLHAKYPQAVFFTQQSLVAGDNQYLIPNSGNVQFNPIGLLLKITTRGPLVNPWQNEADTGAFGWIANIYNLEGSESGTTAYGGKQYIFFETQVFKLEQI
jgi:hypothetical protein